MANVFADRNPRGAPGIGVRKTTLWRRFDVCALAPAPLLVQPTASISDPNLPLGCAGARWVALFKVLVILRGSGLGKQETDSVDGEMEVHGLASLAGFRTPLPGLSRA